ncbi:MAG: hypothetical protein II920_05060, partial [Clostridia bacterium]|nr:hypothetical protein [Clostridia bacterium]
MDKQKPVEKHNNKKLSRKIIVIVAVVAVIVALVLILSNGSTETFNDKYAGKDLETDISGISRENTYGNYLQSRNSYSFRQLGTDDSVEKPVEVAYYMDVRLDSVTDEQTGETTSEFVEATDSDVQSEVIREGGSRTLLTKAGGAVKWELVLKDAGDYSIRIDYTLPDGASNDAVRYLYINGEPAFDGNNEQVFPLEGELNENGSMSLYLYEPESIAQLDLFSLESGITDVVLLSHADGGNLIINDIVTEIKSEDIPYTAFDYSGEEIVVDVTTFEGDGESVTEDGIAAVYQPDGALTSWQVNVPETGFYNVYITYKTTASRGIDIERELYINDELPFAGASTLTFSRLWTDDPASKNADGTYRTDN